MDFGKIEKQKNKLLIAALSLTTGLVTAHQGPSGSGNAGGICGHGTFCHSLVDSFGHGLLGTGWIGFLVIFAVWIMGAYRIIQYSLKKWSEINS